MLEAKSAALSSPMAKSVEAYLPARGARAAAAWAAAVISIRT
jgi:hypothetical protein